MTEAKQRIAKRNKTDTADKIIEIAAKKIINAINRAGKTELFIQEAKQKSSASQSNVYPIEHQPTRARTTTATTTATTTPIKVKEPSAFFISVTTFHKT